MPDSSPTAQPQTRRVRRGLVRGHPKRFALIYLILLIVSNIVDWQADEARVVWGNMFLDRHGAPTYEVDTTGLPVRLNPLPYRVVVEGDPSSALPPVLLLHGSPGAANGFERFAPELSAGGRRVIYLDLPGFASQNEPWSRGRVFEDYSADTYARIVWRLLEAMGDEARVHVVGWSNSGAVGLRMIEQHPDRVATLTLLAAVGAQENEGTGSYAFEHFKYKVGRAVLDHGSHLYPHFGLLGPMGERHAFLRFFDDTDQRDLGALMGSIDTPTMIMHGRHDFLIADRAAEDHYRRMGSARLVMLDAMHFIPMLRPDLAASYLNLFFARHDTPGVAPETGVIDLAPVPERHGADFWLHEFGRVLDEHLPWWGVLILLGVFVRIQPSYGVVLGTLLMAMMRVDFGVVLLAIIAGRTWWLCTPAAPSGPSRVLDRPWTILGWARSLLFFLPAFVIGALGAGPTLMLTHQLGLLGFVIGAGGTTLALITLRLVVTWEGRQRIRGWLRRRTNHEYWSTAIIYLPVLWWGLKRVLSGRGLRPITACNPGYAPDGGVRGESKHDVNLKLGDDPSVLHCELVASCDEPASRIERAVKLVRDEPRLGGYPVICKPDRGERGRAVAKAHNDDELAAYCQKHAEDFVIQRYHPGPHEVGVLWVRRKETIGVGAEDHDEPGFIYAINIKHFPELVGDGKRSLRQLILAHPRHRAQARVFIERLRRRQHEIPGEGERVSLGFAGNHAQGAKFTDGGELITEALTDRINTLVSRFSDAHGRGFDIGRFDLRCESLEALARGEGLGIVELNGLTSEPTNLYDPGKTLAWAWAQLLGYWRHAEALAEARLASGTGEAVDAATYQAIKRELALVMLRG